MRPGPTAIIACPICNGTAAYGTLLSGNTFGARQYTDGKMLAPMLPQPPSVLKCPHCRGFYWLTDARTVATIEGSNRGMSEYAKVASVQEPTEEEYFQAIAGGLARDRKQEKSLRILTWWRSNDKLRSQTFTSNTQSEACRNNLEELVSLFDNDDEADRLTKAEVLRHLSRFEDSLAVLNTIKKRPLKDIAWHIRTLCRNEDSVVREIVPRPWWKFW
jgi:hypothetical protein